MTVKWILIRYVFAIACLLSPLSVNPVHAQLSIDLGLDKGTRDLINGLPEEIRKQVETAVRNLLPDLDAHVEKYIADVDTVIHKNIIDGINQLQCSSTAV